MTRPRRSDQYLWGGAPTVLGLVLAGAAILRLVGIEYGLPFPGLLDPDEQQVVPRAWQMAHGGGADPGFYDWPTLVTYAQAPLQWFHDAPSYLTARFVTVASAVAGVAAAWWLGKASYGVVAGGVAAAVTAVDATHVAYSHAAVTDVPFVTLVTVALALLVSGRIELAGIAVGLAAAAKYPGALLLVPLAVAAWRRWSRLAVSAGLALASFALASPFVLLRAGETWDALRRLQADHRAGWLGFERDRWSGVAFADQLWEGMGPVLVIAVVGLLLALAQRRRPADLVLPAFVLAYFAALLPLGSHFDRYVLPLVPVLGALAGRLTGIAAVTVLLLVVPFTWAVRDDVRLTRTDTRVAAARWIAGNVPRGARIAADPSTAVPAGYRVVPLALPSPRRPADPRRDRGALTAGGIRWVVVSGAVADRVRAARGRYPQEARFYDELGLARFRAGPGDRLSGPWVAVYRLYPG